MAALRSARPGRAARASSRNPTYGAWVGEHGHPDDVDGHDEGREREREGRRGPAHAAGALHGLIIAPLTADGDGEISHAIAGRIPIPYDAEGA